MARSLFRDRKSSGCLIFLQGLHVHGKEKGVLQNLGHMIGVAFLEFPDGGISGQCYAIQLQLGISGQMAYNGRVLGLPALHRSFLLSLFVYFFVFRALQWGDLLLLDLLLLPLLLLQV